MNAHSNVVIAPPAYDALTDRTRAIWTSGDFGQIAAGYEASAAEFIARLGLGAGDRVLDVACGTGNLTLPAARSGATVTGIDIAGNLVEQARARAAFEQLSITLDVGDAESLPYEVSSFDTVVSMFGAMFAARPESAASELLRVTRTGGRIAMANWTPTGFVGEMLKITMRYAAPPAVSVPSPLMWGTEEHVLRRLGNGTERLDYARRICTFEYPLSPAGVVEHFRLYYGPMLRAFASVDGETQRQLRSELEALWTEHNRATDGSTRVQSEYLEVIAVVQ